MTNATLERWAEPLPVDPPEEIVQQRIEPISVIYKKGVARVLEKFKSRPANSPLHVLLALQGKVSSVGRGHNKRGLVDLRQHRRTVMSHPSVKQGNGGIRGGVHRLRGDALQVFVGLRLLIHLTNELRRRSPAILLQIPAEIEIALYEIRVALKDKKFIYEYQG